MEKGIQNSRGAKPVDQDISSMWWTRTSRLSIKKSLSLRVSGLRVHGSEFRMQGAGFRGQGAGFRVQGAGFRVCG